MIADPVDAAAVWQEHTVGQEYTAIHQIMRDFMENQGVRAGSLAVRTHGELRLSPGYTFAEADYSDTRPDSLFRLASVSKAFAAAAIHRRSDGGSLTWTRRCSSSSVALPGQTKDPRVDAITIQPIATTPADEIATRPASIRSSKAATSPEPWNCPTGSPNTTSRTTCTANRCTATPARSRSIPISATR